MFAGCRSLAILVFCTSAGFVAAGDADWKILKPSNTGIPGEEVRVVRLAPDGKLWVGARWPFWSEGGIGIFDFDTKIWTTYANWETPIPSEYVNDIEFAPDGAAWIATSNGLVRFDGINWTIYDTANAPLVHNVISDIDIDADGHLWINNSGVQTVDAAIYEFDGETWSQFKVGDELPWELPWEQLSDVIVDHLGHVWVANTVLNGVAEYDGEAWTLHGANVGRFGEIVEDFEGNIWLRAGIGGGNSFWKFDRTSFTHYPITTTPTSIGVDDDGAVYTGDWFGNVRKTTDGGHTWTFYLTGLNQVFEITPDLNSDDVWIGTIGAVGHFAGNGGHVRDYNSYNTGMPWYWIDNMSVDRCGHFWMSVGETGASRFDGMRWRNWGLHNAGAEFWPFAGNEPIAGVYEDAAGNIYMGGNGIARWDQELTVVTGFWNWQNNPDMGVTLFPFFAEDMGGRLFAIAEYATIYHFDAEVNLWVKEPVQPYAPSGVPGVDTDTAGNVYVSGWFDIHKWDGSGWSMIPLPYPDYFFDLGGIGVFTVGPNDVMYMGTNDGLVIYDGESFTVYDQFNSPLPAKQVVGLDVRDDGLIGLSSHEFQAQTPFPSGVVTIDGPPGNFNNWSVYAYGDAPLPHYQLGKVAFDAAGDMWISALSEGVAVLQAGMANMPADIDEDGDVDLADYLLFANCFTGPGGDVSPDCVSADIDENSTADLKDFAILQAALEGAEL